MSEFKRYKKLLELKSAESHLFRNFSQQYFAEDLSNLINLQAVQKRVIAKSSKIYVLKESLIDKYLDSIFPSGKPSENPNHQEAALHSKDAHKAKKRDVVSINIRSTLSRFILSKTNCSLDIGPHCESGLAYCLPIYSEQENWSFSGTVCTVENLDNFWKAEREIKADLYLYLAGNFSDQILQYLASENLENCKFIHWGDYDPVGLRHYLKIREACGKDRSELYLPDNIDELIKSGNESRVEGQKLHFHSSELCTNGKHLLQLLLDHGKGRDQEVNLS